MGGSGGGGYQGLPSDYRAKLDGLIAQERQTLNAQVDQYLATFLAAANAADPQLVRKRLDDIAKHLRGAADVEQLLFGGSVAKRTSVDGISDVDAFVLLDRDPAQTQQPQFLTKTFAEELRVKMPGLTIVAEKMSVTVQYQDRMIIELLPAVRRGNDIMIGRPDGVRWQRTAPKIFREELTKANQRTGGNLIRVIKLFKVANGQQPSQKQLEGYHIEAMATECTKGYDGPFTPRALFGRFLESAAQRVLTPMSESTGQSRYIDEYLGAGQSLERRNVAQNLLGLKRRLDAASSIAEWKSIFGE
ncbi:MAG: hypothetical protein AB7O77_10805 [Phycisphaerales bacterium]